MIEGKYRYKGQENWNYRDFKSEQDMINFLEEDPKEVEEYLHRPKAEKNWAKKWFTDIRDTKKNIKKVQGSPYARQLLAYKFRRIVVWVLIVWIIYQGYHMVKTFQGSGSWAILNQGIMILLLIYICYRIWATIPQAKAQIDYYKKYPHLINYVPTDTKQTVDEIFKNIKNNKQKEVKDGIRK